MTNTAHAKSISAYPQLTEPMAKVALLAETLDLAKDLSLTAQEITEASDDAEKVKAIIERAGAMEEIEAAQQAATKTITSLIAELSEKDLGDGLEQGLLEAEDHREAVKALRTIELEKGRGGDWEVERGQE